MALSLCLKDKNGPIAKDFNNADSILTSHTELF